jgi:DNA-binding NarL/FixJ family response regulator
MAAGAAGYLLKSVAPGELREKVRMAARGEPDRVVLSVGR